MMFRLQFVGILFFNILAVYGCYSSSKSIFEDIYQGIYTQEISTISDSCTGSYISTLCEQNVDIYIGEENLLLSFVRCSEYSEYSVSVSRMNFGEDMRVHYDIKSPNCGDENQYGYYNYTIDIVIEEFSRSEILVKYVEEWSDLVECPPGIIHTVPAVPETDCGREYEIHYRLQEVCELPCHIIREIDPSTLESTIICSCD